MTIFMFANNVDTTLAGPISPASTSLTLSSVAHLPASIPAGQVLVITLNDAATKQNFETIYATAVSGATLSGLLRAQEGTAALSWATGDLAYSSPTAGQQASFGQLAAVNTWAGTNTFTNPINVPPAVSSGEAVNLGQIPGQFPSSLGSSGYKKIADPNSPSGYWIEQWGSVTFPNSGQTSSSYALTFPIQFPNACSNISGTCLGHANSSAGFTPSVGALSSPTTTGVSLVAEIFGGGPSSVTFNQAVPAMWRAIGW